MTDDDKKWLMAEGLQEIAKNQFTRIKNMIDDDPCDWACNCKKCQKIVESFDRYGWPPDDTEAEDMANMAAAATKWFSLPANYVTQTNTASTTIPDGTLLYDGTVGNYPITSVGWESGNPAEPITYTIRGYAGGGGMTPDNIAVVTKEYLEGLKGDGLFRDAAGAIILKAEEKMIKLPDGSVIDIQADGNYEIVESGKVKYKANWNRQFNEFVNASDQIANFLDYVRGLGVKREEVAKLPLGLFVTWLVVSAAEKDHDDPPEVTPVPKALLPVVRPRCLFDRRFIPRSSPFPYCRPVCAEKHYKLIKAA